MNVNDHLIWEHQQHCQISLQLAAEELFNSLDERLSPKIFLIGILVKPDRERPAIVLECPDDEYTVKDFISVKALSLQYNLQIQQEQPPADNDNMGHLNMTYTTEVQKTLRSHVNGKDNENFISFPVYIEGYLVYVVTELNKRVLNTYYYLTKDRHSSGQKLSRSFIESVINVFLDASANALTAKSQSDFNVLNKSRDELVSKAGHHFMTTISMAGQNPNGLHVLFDACNTISSLKYEGAEGFGKMVIAHKDHQNVKITMELEKPIHIKDFRKVRKFLELADNKQLILCDSALIYGLCQLTGKYNHHDESLFIVNFTKHFHWEVVHHENIMIAVAFRMPDLYNEKISREKFYSNLKRLFTGIDKSRLNTLWDITIEATKQKHGTILAISSEANKEAVRLSSQCFKIKPIRINKDIIHQITSIDGAVLIDTDCTCHAIGVILDGIATENGDSSRGARYNSAVRYYEYMENKAQTVLVVISEDGIIDLIPDLKPQVKHSVIIRHIRALTSLSQADKFLRRNFNRLMEFFQENDFYLTPKECASVNKLRRTLEFKYKDDDDGVKMIWNNLVPDRNMHSGYYLKE
ncbi:DNA integrity scanning protein DisA nucleotide-binding domain protein [Pedobacter sp. L105]|uniref:DNA integrity scanning protein DisA nucleotide-binding domain protein n=1 Tax=Pedobacter sp. L105 TaxID=1641871 RepID=UPI001C203357|nr:DNA integrity scanning protein DisA nucleotide-binding domain protein [Pedobacter sp. L105]